MGRRRRSEATQLDLEWTAPMQWRDLPADVRDELRAQLHELLVQVARVDPGTEGGDE